MKITKNNTKYINIVQSILDVRKVYSEMSDEKFTTFYERKYKVKKGEVFRVLQFLKEKGKL